MIEPLEQRTLLSTAPAPFQPPPGNAPGTIEAEDYNTGGEGVAFHSTAKTSDAKTYRPDAFDINLCTDADGGFSVGAMRAAEWASYTVNVSTAAAYTVDLRVRAPAGGGAFHVSVDLANRSGAINIPAAGWADWTTVSTVPISLSAGRHVVKIYVDKAPPHAAGAVELNWFRLRDDPLTSPRTQAWRDAKYGMLVHLGIYSMLAGHYRGQTTPWYGELIMWGLHIPIADYDKLAAQFNPSKFDARAYVALAQAAGMKYLVVAAKHHDGFAMYNSAASSFNIVKASPLHRDPVRELADACRAAGLGFGIDYSIMDWQHPEIMPYPGGATSPTDPRVQAYIDRQLKPQLKELITQYNPDILWFDGEWKSFWSQERGREIDEFVRRLKPSLIINNRIGKRTSADGDFDTPEQSVPSSTIPARPWETDMSLNDTFGYRDDDKNWKSPATVIKTLVDVVSKGGNFLLNVGPDGSGVIPAASVDILRQAGQWVTANGAAIYSATRAPITTTPWGSLTRKGNTLYAFVFNWPANGTLHLNIAGKATGARLLVGGKAVAFTSTPRGIDLTLPPTMPQQPATVIQIDFSGAMSAV